MVRVVRNRDQLTMVEGPEKLLRRRAIEALDHTITSVMPDRLMAKVKVKGKRLSIDGRSFRLSDYEEIVVMGAGKACLSMYEYVESLLGNRISRGLIVVPHEDSSKATVKVPSVKVVGASHPLPDEDGLNAAREMLNMANSLGEKTLVLFLLSGGASSLLPSPAEPVTLEEKVWVTKELMRAGASIEELNAVRKHLSSLKGGQLAKALHPATVVTIAISDVVGDRMDIIGSGPTAPDPSTFGQALSVLKSRGIWDRAPRSVTERLTRGLYGEIPETPKPGDPLFKNVHNFIVGSNLDACKAASRFLKRLGFSTFILTNTLKGESREVAKVMCSIARDFPKSLPKKRRLALVAGGETTVTVRGKGRGGRCMEMVLSCCLELKGSKGIVFAALGTDGIDGETDYAGAICDGNSYHRSLTKGLNPEDYLADNDSYGFFSKLGDGIITGRTGTNVGDILLILVSR